MRAYYKDTGLGVLCGLIGKTRQAFYEQTWRADKARFEDAIIVDLVNRERKIARRIGGRKLYLILQLDLERHRIKIGRDKFFEVLRANELLVKRRKQRVQTTMSRHRLRKYPNQVKALQIDRSEQLWVSDITYLSVAGGHGYLILITDAYSRKVVGYNFGKRMDTAFCLVALEQALVHRRYLERQLMHHSDRGVQYCSKAYVARLEQANISISMTEQGDPLENPLAERMNGIFKDNFAMDRDFSTFEDTQKQVQQAIQYYNERLPHSSLDMMTPDQAYDRIGNLKKHWKWYWKEKQELQKLEEQATQADGIPNQTQS